MAALRIGVDAREITGDVTGVGRYLGQLLQRWITRADAGTRCFVLYAPEPVPAAFAADTVHVRVVPPAAVPLAGGAGSGTWWEQTSLRRAVARETLDVFFAPAYTAPLGLRIPVALTVHDVSFAAHPEWFRPREGLRRRWVTKRSAAAAALVFTDSEFSRGEIQTYLRVPPERIQVIPPGLAPRATPQAESGRDPLVLFVGSLFTRRRLPQLIAAFARATTDMPSARLAIVGDDRTWPRQDLRAAAAAAGVATRVDVLRYLPDAELASLYARAAVFVFLSEYEGFGLPPLEALAAGIPVVVLDTPVAREVYGPAAVYVRHDGETETAAAIRTLLTDRSAAAATLRHATDVVARYSWDRAADLTLSALERIAVRRS